MARAGQQALFCRFNFFIFFYFILTKISLRVWVWLEPQSWMADRSALDRVRCGSRRAVISLQCVVGAYVPLGWHDLPSPSRRPQWSLVSNGGLREKRDRRLSGHGPGGISCLARGVARSCNLGCPAVANNSVAPAGRQAWALKRTPGWPRAVIGVPPPAPAGCSDQISANARPSSLRVPPLSTSHQKTTQPLPAAHWLQYLISCAGVGVIGSC